MRVAAAISGILALIVIITAVVLVVRDQLKPGSSAEERRMLNAYTKLTLLAARASRKGFTGEANIYKESADRMIEAWTERHPDDD